MYSVRDDIRLRMPGCPIRTSPDQSLLGGSPELFAAYHVLHRLLAPRHPPCALSSLTLFRDNSSLFFFPAEDTWFIIDNIIKTNNLSKNKESKSVSRFASKVRTKD